MSKVNFVDWRWTWTTAVHGNLIICLEDAVTGFHYYVHSAVENKADADIHIAFWREWCESLPEDDWSDSDDIDKWYDLTAIEIKECLRSDEPAWELQLTFELSEHAPGHLFFRDETSWREPKKTVKFAADSYQDALEQANQWREKFG